MVRNDINLALLSEEMKNEEPLYIGLYNKKDLNFIF